MEQARGENKPQQQEQPPAPLRCPRCYSLDTKFRYYNNHSREQPRHYCKTCKRQWTVGGSLRNIPFGGNHRNPKQTKASSSRCGNPTSQTPPPQSPSEEQQSQNLSQMATIIPQNFDITMIQPMSNPSAAISSSSLYFFNDEISCLAAIQSLIQPQEINQPLNVGNQFCNGSANMSSLHESNTQPMASRQALPQQIPDHIESYQTHNQDNNAVPHHLSNSSLVQPILPTNSFPHDFINDPSSSPSNMYFFGDNMPDMETDWSCVIPGQWPNFPSYSPP